MPAWIKRPDRAAFRMSQWRGTLVPLGHFVLGIALGAGRLFSACAPFGVSAAAALGFGADGAVCLMGTMIGYLLTGDLFYAVRYMAAAAVVFFVGFALRRGKLVQTRWFMPTGAAVLLGLSGLPYIRLLTGGVPGLMRLFLDIVLGGGCAYLFSAALRPETIASEAAELRRSISIAALSACALMGLSAVQIFHVLSVGRFLAMLAVMAADGLCRRCGAGAGYGVIELGGAVSLCGICGDRACVRLSVPLRADGLLCELLRRERGVRSFDVECRPVYLRAV